MYGHRTYGKGDGIKLGVDQHNNFSFNKFFASIVPMLDLCGIVMRLFLCPFVMTNIEVFTNESFDRCCSHLVHTHPLVHCMTNDVVQEITADVLLAAGASPAMIIDEHESADFAAIADGLLINVGTLTDSRNEAMRLAILSAKNHAKPWVLDPVASGLLPWRDERIARFLALQPTVVRGNASEILHLAGLGQGGHGVDSTDDSRTAVNGAIEIAKRYHTIVAVTGETDFVTDGKRTLSIVGGDIMTTLVVGTGCSLSALVAAYCAKSSTPLEATAAALMMAKRAAETAAANSNGPGSFLPAYLDALYSIARDHI